MGDVNDRQLGEAERQARAILGTTKRAGFSLAAMLSLWFGIATVNAAPSPTCDVIDRAALPEPALCRRQFGELAPDALFKDVDVQIKTGGFGLATTALGCAARSIADDDDSTLRYEWVRRRGVLAYREQQIGEALGHFECALQMAERNGDQAAIAKQLRNVGSAQRRIGDYRGALLTLERGLRVMREQNDPAIGGMLSNMADVYRELEDNKQAERYYKEAEAAFRRAGDRVEAAHVLNSLALLALDRRDTATARTMLETALEEVRDHNDRRYQLPLYAVLAQVAIAEGEPQRAMQTAASGLAIADEYDLPIPPVLHLQAARADRLLGRHEPAKARLHAALAQHLDSDADRAALMEELANTLEASGRDAEAIAILREAQEAQGNDLRAQNDRQLAWLRTRFELVESERTITILRQRTLLLWLAIASALAVSLGLALIFVRSRQRARIEEAMQRARYEEMLARYRREANALSEDRDRLQNLFDSRDEALCLLDANGVFLTANRAACVLLGGERERFLGTGLAAWLGDSDADAVRIALERMEDATTSALDIAVANGGTALHLTLTPWEAGDGLIVMRVVCDSATAADRVEPTASTEPDTSGSMMNSERERASTLADIETRASDDVQEKKADEAGAMLAVARASEGDGKADFRCALVELMLAATEAWERSTGQSRIELAERSRIWTVNVDDGRLRTRAMERYLNIAKLPRNPRWRDVLRTSYFVLSESRLDPTLREDLQRRVDTVLAFSRRSSLA